MIVFLLPIFMLSCLGIRMWRHKKGHRRHIKNIAKGTLPQQKMLSQKHQQKALQQTQTFLAHEGSILGINQQTGKPIVLTDKDANLHTLAIGTTGSGKTTTVCNIIESAIYRQLPVFYIDGKGDMTLTNKIKKYADIHQRPFYLFSMMGDSVRYNPPRLWRRHL